VKTYGEPGNPGLPFFSPLKFFDHYLAVATSGGLLAWLVRAINEYGSAVITILTVTYLVLGIRNRWTNKKAD